MEQQQRQEHVQPEIVGYFQTEYIFFKFKGFKKFKNAQESPFLLPDRATFQEVSLLNIIR